jgi:hypothetical protein
MRVARESVKGSRVSVPRWAALLCLVAAGAASCGGETDAMRTVTVTQTVASTQELSGAISAEQAREWKRKWCDSKLGMSRDELIALMGPPTSDVPDNLQWAAFEWTFNAKLNVDGKAYNLQWGDATNPPSADVEPGELPCNWIRVAGPSG